MTSEQPTAPRTPPPPGGVRWTFPKDSVIFNGDGSVSVPAPEQEEAVRELLRELANAVLAEGSTRRRISASLGHMAQSAIRYLDRAVLATPPPVPAAPAALWRLQGEYVVDRDGLVWRVVRDGGMATRAYHGGIESIGIEALRSTKGPLTSLNDFVDAAAGAVPAAPGLDDSERALLRELATGGVAFEIPGKYVEVQHDPGTWHRAQEWFRLHPADPEEEDA